MVRFITNAQAWDYAIGMIKEDGLEPTEDFKILDDAEADYVVYRLKHLVLNPLPGDYHTEHLLNMHKYIFDDLLNGRVYLGRYPFIKRKMC